MKLKYLGTAAAEGIPAVFCTCTVCATARKLKGRHVRTRSQAVLDGTILFDFPPDSYAHYLGGGVDLPAIRHLFVTHSHMDHFFPAELALRAPGYIASTPIETLHIYGNKAVEVLLAEAAKNEGCKARNDFHYMTPFQPVDAGGYRVTSLIARHSSIEECLNYIVQHEGKALLYAHDTGYYPDATWNFLASAGIRFDLISLDCTSMTGKDGTYHMGLQDNNEVRSRLFDLGAADKSTVFAVNHFSHNGGLGHEELSAAAGAEGYIASWDGLELEV